MKTLTINNSIEKAASVIGKTWPLYGFVTSNPLSGYEKSSFLDAVKNANNLSGGSFFPTAAVYTEALGKKEIDNDILLDLLVEKGYQQSPDFYLNQMASEKTVSKENPNRLLDQLTVKWLSAFLDEGMAEWQMPFKSEGFFKAWKKIAVFDDQFKSIKNISADPEEAIKNALAGINEAGYEEIFKFHISSLAGWVGYIKYRTDTDSLWQQKYPISIMDYLAVRLTIAKLIDAQIAPLKNYNDHLSELIQLKHIFLKAWEMSWQSELKGILKENSIQLSNQTKEKKLPDAQMVFCIDTRSELIRRHIESKGNYETFGFAGFFGIAMDYEDLATGISRKSCPPIVPSAYKVSEIPQIGKGEELANYQKKKEEQKFSNYFLNRLKSMLPSAFGFVEGSGILYGVSLLARSIFPGNLYRYEKKNELSHEGICEPSLNHHQVSSDKFDNIPLEQKVAIVKSAFDVMGWKEFAPLVVFAGHGSHTKNNAFGSSLDCGACAASPGRHNARMLAKLANIKEVRMVLKESYNIAIPENTFFLGAEHNTTTDEIVLFDSEAPLSLQKNLAKLKADLLSIQRSSSAERRGMLNGAVKLSEKKANNWAETRPEWGLAKNAGFIIGPRNLSKHVNLGSRCFLQSYDWKTDTTGAVLEAIMQGPMVVTQWINNHYYFSTVDNEKFGGGSKITHNVVGKFGVVQGNGGDLKRGIPLQSVKASDDEIYHQPLRLSVVIEAPTERIDQILERNAHIKSLLENEWIYLMIMDPQKGGEITHYSKNDNPLSPINAIENLETVL
ncbi:DUF2309 domain-containing protein [Pedobacter sp. SD-b]|uniref:Probable inorganic carbon transporter subunit DabA n=1 Tax=Pedobacter segetis TaxID=2793069 RepID=A0ABS1BMN2_9SPHI|nr:DUF2309 domain-containing protein [Pedobacter segetis]MBK0383454.1 DUF2309 domain-containing protein [Pedobacter segetis]